ncbi:MAG: ornithine carbamoyltransferase [Dehalococcoidia bacterium]|nr:MAG: ornithine carbamoyltransferase [Dehalococcoidia bacterium]
MKGKDLLSITDLEAEDIRLLIADAISLKAQGWLDMLSGKSLAIMFEKPSLRTRVSFELAMRQLGGEAIYLSPAEVGLGGRESVPDVAKVLSRYVDAVAARTFSHRTLEVLAEYSAVPVINALSDWEHPCQALADLLTITEKKGELQGLTLAFVGDGNNVARSLMLAASLTGMNFRIASPADYTIDEGTLTLARSNAADGILCTDEPRLAVEGADIVYTDVWASMGQEDEAKKRSKAFAGYQVDAALFSLAKPDAIFMHDLPAHRGEEVTDEVIDGARSVVFEQAENRLHAQKALLAAILGGLEIPLAGYYR